MDSDSGASVKDRTRLAVVLVVFAAAVALIFAANNAFFRDYQAYFTPPSPAPPPAPVTRLVIDFGNGQKRAFLGPVEPEMTIVTALRASGIAGNFSASFNGQGRVLAIAGVQAFEPERWNVYVNGALLSTPPGEFDVRSGDRILFRYE